MEKKKKEEVLENIYVQRDFPWLVTYMLTYRVAIFGVKLSTYGQGRK